MTSTPPGSIDFNDFVSLRAGPQALYHSLGHMIRSKVQSAEWLVGQRIPSEREMMQVLNISRATVRQGIDNLVKEGILYRVQGKGTFVAPPKVERGVLRLMEFSDVVRQNGLTPQVQLLAKQNIDPPHNIQNFLSLASTEPVTWLQRLLLLNNTPILIEASYFSAARFPDLLDAYDGSADPHQFVAAHYGVKITRAREMFEPVILEEKEARLLGTQRGFPALWVEHIAYESLGATVAYITSLMRGDRCRFYTDLVFEKG
jgi:GntR family transcriptional regulator